jgi:hypothetical protein
MSSGGFAYDEPEDLNGSPWLSKAGLFHVTVMEQDPQPTNANKERLDGLRVKFGVLAGSDPTQADKQSDQLFFRGKATDKDGGKFANLKLHKLFCATGLKNGLNPGKQTSVNTADMVGRQCVIEIEAKPDNKNPSIIRHQIKGDRIFHIDDPEVAGVPKNADALAMIPAELRRSPSSFVLGGGAGHGSVGGSPNHAPAAAAHVHKPVSPMELLNSQRTAKVDASTI